MDLSGKTKEELIEEINRIIEENKSSQKSFPGISVISKYERRLSESEEKYKHFFDLNPLPMWVYNKKTLQFMAVNDAAIAHYGYSREEFISMAVTQIYVKEETPLFLESNFLLSIDNIDKKSTGNWRHIKKDKAIIDVTAFGTDLLVNRKEAQLVLIKDITEQRNVERSLRQTKEDYRNLIEYSPDGVFIHNEKGIVIFANPSALKMIGIKSLDEINNKNVFQYLLPEYHNLIKEKKENTDTLPFLNVRVKRMDGNIINVEFKTIPIIFEGKNATLAVCHDITLQRKLEKEQLRAQVAEEINKKLALDIKEKKITAKKITQSLKEKEVLLKEVHHRVKNNLQVISSILNLQSAHIKDPHMISLLRESQNRIKTMAFIHESLYQAKDFSSVNFTEYVENLTKNILFSYKRPDKNIKIKLDVKNIFLNLDLAISCGLIINELVSNSLKHAFPDNKKGEIFIGLYLEKKEIKLIVSDNGSGLPKQVNYRNTKSLGLQLVITLVDQLNGKIELENKRPTTRFIIQFTIK